MTATEKRLEAVILAVIFVGAAAIRLAIAWAPGEAPGWLFT